MRRLGRTLRQRQPSQAKTIAQKVAAILRKYGTDAHVYLPGIGVINGLTAGNYLDSAGTTAATVDNPVGLVLDAAGSVGSEIKSTGTLAQRGVSTASTYDTTTGVGSVSRVNSTNQSSVVFACNANSTYRITVTNSTANLLNIRDGSDIGTLLQQVPANTTATYHLKLSLTSIAIAAASDGVTVNFTISSIKEVTGINALQATTANKPILRSASGKYYWSSDSTDLLTATFPAGYEAATIINTAETGQVTYTAQNIVGTYDIRGAVIGSELVSNGTFDTDTAWTKVAIGTGTVASISGGNAVLPRTDASNYGYVHQTVSVTTGKTYIATIKTGAGSVVQIRAGGSPLNSSAGAANLTANNLNSFVFTATAASQVISLLAIDGVQGLVDLISIREITPKEYGRFIFRTGLTASELTTMQTFANRLAGV